jgi:spermidine/putrescine-binding protein
MKLHKLLVVVLILPLLLAACGGQTGEAQELNLYGWSEYVPQALLDGFTKETGIQVNYDTYSSNEELLSKLQAGASGYDIIIPSDYTVSILINLNLLEPIDRSKVQNFKNLDPKFTGLYYDPENRYSVPYQWGTLGMAVDTEKVDREITSWNELWDPQFENRVLLVDDVREVLGMVLISLGYDRNTTDPAQLEEAKQRLMELLPNVRLFDSDSPKNALLSGEVWLGVMWNGDATLAHQENPAITYICPQEGCGVWYDNMSIPKDPPHPDAAHAFINYVLTPEASLLITEEYPYSNPNAAALELLKSEDPEAYAAYMESPATNPPADVLTRAYPVKDVGAATALWDQIWTEVKGGE